MALNAEPATFAFSAEPWWSWNSLSVRQAKQDDLIARADHYYFFWARNAIYHCLQLLQIEPGSRVLLPSYICRAAVDPFLAYGLAADFYAVKRDCAADLSDIEASLTPNTKIILAAHYFGFPQAMEEIRRISDRYQLALIEDCAHVLAGEINGQPLGTFGDAAVFSWRKFLPVYDGGELVIKHTRQTARMDTVREAPLFTLRVAWNVIERSLRQGSGRVSRLTYSSLRAIQTAARTCVDKVVSRPPALRVETSSTEFDKSMVDLPMSRVSRWIKKHSDVEAIIGKRRRNYELLRTELMSHQDIVPLFPQLPVSICPWVFPVFFTKKRSAHRLLRSRGIPAVAWDDVRHPDIRAGRFKDADYLYENLVFLPIHQCLREQDVRKIAAVAKAL
jgi:dTDP-4-amino-4,6-dideoxygalactose transaminase